jgi:ABC-type multidrug transport system permease subunit
MRIETITAWIFIGFGLLMIGTLLYMFEITEGGKLARFLAVIGLVYFCIGVMLTLTHDRHMAKRTRAGRE